MEEKLNTLFLVPLWASVEPPKKWDRLFWPSHVLFPIFKHGCPLLLKPVKAVVQHAADGSLPCTASLAMAMRNRKFTWTHSIQAFPLPTLYVQGRLPSFGRIYTVYWFLGFPHGSVVKTFCLPMQETWIQFLGWEDPLGKGMGTPAFLPGESHGQKSLVGCSSWSCKRVRHKWVTKRAHTQHIRPEL